MHIYVEQMSVIDATPICVINNNIINISSFYLLTSVFHKCTDIQPSTISHDGFCRNKTQLILMLSKKMCRISIGMKHRTFNIYIYI